MAKRVASIVISVVLLIGAAGLLIPSGDGLSLFGVGFYAVLTESMTPTISAGSVVVVTRTDTADIEAGDVITYHPVDGTDTLVTHRVVGVSEGADGPQFTTQGDANNTVDPNPVTTPQVLGRARFWIPALGFLTTSYRPIVVSVLVALIALWIIVNLLSGKKSAKREPEETKSP